jgi:hypothetical protein
MTNFFKFIIKSRIGFIISGLALVIMITYTVAGISAGRKKIKSMNTKYLHTKPLAGNDNEEIFEMRKENAFLLNRLTMAKGDSVALFIDLKDSVVTLDLKGVSIHRAKILHYDKSSVFDGLDNSALIKMMSNPLVVKSQYSTIIKEPRFYKKAPKDTIEAAALEVKKDTMENVAPSFYYLRLNNGIEVGFEHHVDDPKMIKPIIHKQRMQAFWATTDSIKKMALPEYIPTIRLELEKSDAKTIYRAIPSKTYVSIRF